MSAASKNKWISTTVNGSDHISDSVLLENYYRDGNSEWLGILLQRYTMMLFGVCMKYLKNEEDARDSVQQIFLKAITELDKYKVQYVKSWLYMIAKNHCLMRIRDRQGKVPESLREDQSYDHFQQNEPIDFMEREQVIALLEAELQNLNAEQKQCVTLFYLQKRSYQQISEQTGFTLLQVKSYIQNGKRNLKTVLEKAFRKSRRNE